MRYMDFERQYYSPEIYEYLKEREFCYNPVKPLPLVKYTEVFSDLWKRFAKSEQTAWDYVIFDGSFLHHQINDLIRNYSASEEDINKHLTEIVRAVGVLNPNIFYLSPQDVGEQLRKALDNRGKTAPTKRDIDFWQTRKDMDLRVLKRLSVQSYVLDIANNNWDSVPDTILMSITKAKV